MMRQLILVVSLIGAVGLAAQPKLEFEKAVHDFGQIKEADGAAEYSFIFRNTGSEPLLINNVKASCGCTTPSWTREPVAPGASGQITARYNTLNRPGPFNKTLTVTSNNGVGVIVLSIKGSVEPKVKTIEDHLPTKYGSMRIINKSLNLGKITTEKLIVRDFDVYNDSDTAFSFLPQATKVSEHIQLTFEPLELKPREKGVVRMTYDPVKRGALGYHTEQVVIGTTDYKEPEKTLNVVATIEEYFPPMTEEELAKAPKLLLDRREHNFGKILPNAVVETSFTLTNTGKSELNIRSTLANCTCTVATLEKETLKPGESTKLKITFDSKGRRGKQYKNVAIFSNDPAAPTQVVNIKVEI